MFKSNCSSEIFFGAKDRRKGVKTMKIAISASGPDLDDQVDSRFGRAPFFLLIDPDTLECEAMPNSRNLQAAHGAGIQAAAQLAGRGPEVVLTGHCGPKAFQALQAAGIKVVVGVTGPVRDAVQHYRLGEL
jgi:predicted Fe-Mo cluster-binding NifX family protein